MKTPVIQNLSESWHAPAKQSITSVPDNKAPMPFQLDTPFSNRFGRGSRRGLGYFCVAAIAFALGRQIASAATTIYLDSGVSGSLTGLQSYNETRAVDVSVLSPENLTVTSMTLSGIYGIGDDASALIYDSTGNLIASSSGNVMNDGTVTVSISATLISGDEYQIGFSGDLLSGALFDPGSYESTLPNIYFPYTESSGLLRITGAYDGALDSFVTEPNEFEPQISMQVVQVPEPGSAVFLAIGLLCASGFRRPWAK